MEQRVRPGVLGVEGQVHGGGGVVAPRAGDDLYTVIDPLDAVLHHGDVLPNGHGGRFAGGAAHADGVHTALDLIVDEAAEGVVVDVAVGVKGGGDGHAVARKNRSSHNAPFLFHKIGDRR